MIDVAIMGHGTVGSGVAEILINSKDEIGKKVNNDINVKYILDLREFKDLPYSDKFITDFNIILNDPDVKVVAEVMGGLNPAYDFVKKCLQNGKSVVTSNKELVAAKGAELIKIAKDNNVNFLFEASVGGGIPILRPLVQCLAANEITEIKGILNGTTNYILNKMIVDNMDFDTALKLAQDKGFAEKNPAADIEGHDACRKVCILASLGFGKHVYPEQVQTEGITNIDLDDVAYAGMFGYVIKLIGSAKKAESGKITANVRPTLLSKDYILANVNGVFNAISVIGDAVGEVVFYGQGAGKMATASAVVADIMDCVKHIDSRKYLFWEDGDKDYVVKSDEKTSLFVRATAKDFDTLVTNFNNVFGNEIKVIKNNERKEIAFITDADFESALTEKIAKLNADSVKVIHTLL